MDAKRSLGRAPRWSSCQSCRFSLSRQVAEADVFQVHKLRETVARSFAAKSRLFPSTKGNGRTGERCGVDTDHPVLHSLGKTQRAPQVVRVKVTGKTHLRRIGPRQHLLLTVER